LKPIVFALPGGDVFAARFSRAIDAELAQLSTHRFPDGETLVRLEADVSGRYAVFAGSLDQPDDKTLPLLFAADAARDLGAAKIILVAPYLGYMRQDKRFRPGEAITSRTYASLISSAIDALITVDPHLHRYHSLDEIYRIPSRVVASAPLIAEWMRENIVNPLLIGPDSESEQWVAEVANGIGAPYTVLQKTRHGDRDVSVSLPDAAQWLDKNPVLIDDIVSSGHTLIEAAASLHRAGLAPPVCIGVHALFALDAYQQLLAGGVSRVVTCDTVPHVSNAISVVDAVAHVLRQMILENR
jgi:ribose-phosphate pyrophosphokinase